MLIDWITCRVPESFLSPELWAVLRLKGDQIVRLDPLTGEVRYCIQAWDSVRSDSHQITVRLGADAFWMQGSPARVMGDGCAVFGPEDSSKLDLYPCLEAMRGFVCKMLGVVLPGVDAFIVSRVDVTGNLDLGSENKVREALRILRDCDGGRYRVSQQAGDTVYWSHKSRLRKGKAYAKGPHLRHMAKKATGGRIYTTNELTAAEMLLRLELTLGSQWFHKNAPDGWQSVTGYQLQIEWDKYFQKMVGSAMITDDVTLFDSLQVVAPSRGQALAALSFWTLVQSQGFETAKNLTSKSTFYRNLNVLRAAGLGDADISAGKVVALRRSIIEARVVDSWSEILAA